jgi:hypothetical protein
MALAYRPPDLRFEDLKFELGDFRSHAAAFPHAEE